MNHPTQAAESDLNNVRLISIHRTGHKGMIWRSGTPCSWRRVLTMSSGWETRVEETPAKKPEMLSIAGGDSFEASGRITIESVFSREVVKDSESHNLRS